METPSNKLDAWLKASRRSPEWLADRLSKSYSQTLNYLRPLDHAKFAIPPKATLRRIHILTNGLVSVLDFYDVGEWNAKLSDMMQANNAASLKRDIARDEGVSA